MTRNEMRRQIRFLSLIEEREVSDDQLDMLLNEGFGRVTGRQAWPFGIGKEGFLSVEGQALYPLAGGARTIISVLDRTNNHYLRSATLERIIVMDNENPHPATPLLFCLNESITNYGSLHGYTDEYFDKYAGERGALPGDQMLRLYPRSSESGIKYETMYRHMVTFEPGGDAVPVWTEDYHDILIDWALHRLWEREENFDRSDRYRSRFEATLSSLVTFYNTRSEDRPLIFGESNQPHPYTALPVGSSNMPWLEGV